LSPAGGPAPTISPLWAEYLSPGREPWGPKALTPPPATLSRRPAARRTCARSPMGTALWAAGRAGDGKGRGRVPRNPRLTPWARLCRSFGAEFFNELLHRTGKSQTMPFVLMKVFEEAPRKFDAWMQLITLGRLQRIREEIASSMVGGGARVL